MSGKPSDNGNKKVERLMTEGEESRKVEHHDIDPDKSVAENMKEVDAFIYLAEEGRVSDYEFYYMVKQ